MRVFDDLEGTDAGPTRDWVEQHLPDDRAAVLLHGDLLGQNILVFPDQAPADLTGCVATPSRQGVHTVRSGSTS